MKRSSDYNDLLLKAFIRESFIQCKKEDLFERKKLITNKKLIKEEKIRIRNLKKSIDEMCANIDKILFESYTKKRYYNLKNVMLNENSEILEEGFLEKILLGKKKGFKGFSHDPTSFDNVQIVKKLGSVYDILLKQIKKEYKEKIERLRKSWSLIDAVKVPNSKHKKDSEGKPLPMDEEEYLSIKLSSNFKKDKNGNPLMMSEEEYITTVGTYDREAGGSVTLGSIDKKDKDGIPVIANKEEFIKNNRSAAIEIISGEKDEEGKDITKIARYGIGNTSLIRFLNSKREKGEKIWTWQDGFNLKGEDVKRIVYFCLLALKFAAIAGSSMAGPPTIEIEHLDASGNKIPTSQMQDMELGAKDTLSQAGIEDPFDNEGKLKAKALKVEPKEAEKIDNELKKALKKVKTPDDLKKVAKVKIEKVDKSPEPQPEPQRQTEPQQQAEPETQQQQQAEPEQSPEAEYDAPLGDDKASREIEKEAQKLAAEHEDAEVTTQEQEASDSDMQQIEDATSSNIEKVNNDMRASSQYEQDSDSADDYWDSLSDQEREEFAGKVDNMVKTLMQDELRSGKIGDALDRASEEAGENKGKFKHKNVTSVEGEIDKDMYSGDPKVIATDKASDFETQNNSEVDLKDWGAGPVDDLGDELADDIETQFESPDVKPHIIDAFKQAGIKNPEATFDKMLDRVKNKARLSFQGMVQKAAQGQSSQNLNSIESPVDGSSVGVTSAQATNQSVK